MHAVRVIQSTSGDALILRLCGEIDSATIGHARSELSTAVGALSPPWHVVLDLTRVEFLGVGGLHMLAALSADCTERNVGVRIVTPPQGVVCRAGVRGASSQRAKGLVWRLFHALRPFDSNSPGSFRQ